MLVVVKIHFVMVNKNPQQQGFKSSGKSSLLTEHSIPRQIYIFEKAF
jgi:hypothetical protein